MATIPADWPNEQAEYERPEDTPDNTETWQAALNRALKEKSLKLERTNSQDLLLLSGACPRCGHATRQDVWLDFVEGLRRDTTAQATINFDCTCDGPHVGDDEADGCGWGGPVSVTLTIPAQFM